MSQSIWHVLFQHFDQIYIAFDFNFCMLVAAHIQVRHAAAAAMGAGAAVALLLAVLHIQYGHCYDLCGRNISGVLPANACVLWESVKRTRRRGWWSWCWIWAPNKKMFRVQPSEIQFRFAPHQKTNKSLWTLAINILGDFVFTCFWQSPSLGIGTTCGEQATGVGCSHRSKALPHVANSVASRSAINKFVLCIYTSAVLAPQSKS